MKIGPDVSGKEPMGSEWMNALKPNVNYAPFHAVPRIIGQANRDVGGNEENEIQRKNHWI